MKRSFLALAVVGLVAGSARVARADGQVSFDVQAMAAVSPLDGGGGPAAHTSALVAGTMPLATSSSGAPSDAIVGVEVRPSFAFSRGLRIGVGFRAGRGATFGDGTVDTGSTTMWGGDVSLGLQRWFGRVMPFIEARFGFNAYSFDTVNGPSHAEQLRLDGVLGARLYLGSSFYLAAAAFGGWGDRYGGSLGLGWDLIRYRNRGVLP